MKSLSSFKPNLILSVVLFAFLDIYTFAALQLPVIAISGGEDHTLVLGENFQVFSCDDNQYYQLGLGYPANDYEPSLLRVHGANNVYVLGEIADISAGWKHSLALDSNETVWAWGEGFYLTFRGREW